MTEAQEERIGEALAALPSEAAMTVERGWQDDLALARLAAGHDRRPDPAAGPPGRESGGLTCEPSAPSGGAASRGS